MYVGSFGDIPFIVARGYVRTFKDYGRESSGRLPDREAYHQADQFRSGSD